MWVGARGELHSVAVPLWAHLGPVLRHRLAALPLAGLRELGRTVAEAGLNGPALFEAVTRAIAAPDGRVDLEAEREFVGVPLPESVRLEVAEDLPAARLAEELLTLVSAVPPRWRPDVVLALEDLLWALEDRRPARERRDTLWRRYGDRHRGGRQHPLRARRRRTA